MKPGRHRDFTDKVFDGHIIGEDVCAAQHCPQGSSIGSDQRFVGINPENPISARDFQTGIAPGQPQNHFAIGVEQRGRRILQPQV